MSDEQKTNIWEGNWSGNTFHRKHICEQTDGGTIHYGRNLMTHSPITLSDP